MVACIIEKRVISKICMMRKQNWNCYLKKKIGIVKKLKLEELDVFTCLREVMQLNGTRFIALYAITSITLSSLELTSYNFLLNSFFTLSLFATKCSVMPCLDAYVKISIYTSENV